MILGFVVGLLLLFGPAVMAEGRYQLKSAARALGSETGSWKEVLTPKIQLRMVPEEKVMGFGIEIPKLFVQESVVANVDPTDKNAYLPALKQGIAHAAGTGLPGDGQMGYYFAHSSEVSLQASHLNAVFYLLGKLEKGDEVYLWSEGKRFDYQVERAFVTSAQDVSWLAPQAEEEQIALQTCWPVGTSLKRLVVVARRVKDVI